MATRPAGEAYHPQFVRQQGEGLAMALGLFSLALGAAQVAAPGVMSRLVGASPTPRRRTTMRSVGLRELANGFAILTQPRQASWLWSRLAGDAVDLALLARVTTDRRNSKGRAIAASAAVLGVAALDYMAANQLTVGESARRDIPVSDRLASTERRVARSVTIHKDRADVEAAWAARSPRPPYLDDGATVHFNEAPGDRGTEVQVRYRYRPKAGMLGASALMVARDDPSQRIRDDLRRFKQELEIGEVLVSDASLTRGAHPARPHARAM